MASDKIELLSDLEHVLLRPEIYVSSTNETDEVVHVITQENGLQSKTMSHNVGLYKLFSEILDNSIDIHKKTLIEKPKRLSTIDVSLNLDTNKITVKDNGPGFKDAIKINKKSRITNIETAYTYLKAGSNFKNEDVKASVIGMNGMGGTLVNMLSDYFEVQSHNSNTGFFQTWTQFMTDCKPKIIRGKQGKTGTTVSFIPRSAVFKSSRYNADIILTQLCLRKMCLSLDPILKNIQIRFFVASGGTIVEVEIPQKEIIFPGSNYILTSDNSFIVINPNYSISDLMMINSTQCMGSPIRYMREVIDKELFKNEKASRYYSIQMFMNLPPAMIKFQDQNKSRYAIPINQIKPLIEAIFDNKNNKFRFRFPISDTYKKILENINSNENNKDKQGLEKDKKKIKILSDSFFPASKDKESLFIVEGNSARGSILQKRNPQIHAVYGLRGKIQNCSKIAHLRSNPEIMDLITILDLKFDTNHSTYKNIIICADADPDGYHIASLIINFFYRWFPDIITSGKLFIFRMPLMITGSGKEKRYLYSMKEIDEVGGKGTYLKGLGAMSEEDWAHVFSNMSLYKVCATPDSMKYLDIAFDNTSSGASDVRKEWLNGNIQ